MKKMVSFFNIFNPKKDAKNCNKEKQVFESFATIENIENEQVKLVVEYVNNSENGTKINKSKVGTAYIVMFVQTKDFPTNANLYHEQDVVEVLHDGEKILRVLGKCPEEMERRAVAYRARVERLKKMARR